MSTNPAVRLLRRLQAWPSRHPRIVDATLAGLFTLVVAGGWLLPLIVDRGPQTKWEYAGYVAISLVMGLALVWRRTHPVATFAAVAAACVAQLLTTDTPLPSNLAVPAAAYSLSRWSDHRLARLAGLVVCVASGPLAMADWKSYGTTTVAGFLISSAFFAAFNVVAWVWGDLNRKRAELVAGLRAQNDALMRERDQRVRLAAQEERNRIARDMHDVVAHHLSVIVVQADGARYAATHPGASPTDTALERAGDALGTIATTARSALGDTRRLVGVLRDGEGPDDPQWAPAAGAEDIAALVDQVRGAGHDVTLVGDAGEVPADVGLAAYRVVQEGLTNVLRHAGPGARSRVTIERAEHELTVRVTDDGTGPDGGGSDAGGNGLVGMRERVHATGGTFRAAARPGCGFEVVANLPLAEGS